MVRLHLKHVHVVEPLLIDVTGLSKTRADIVLIKLKRPKKPGDAVEAGMVGKKIYYSGVEYD